MGDAHDTGFLLERGIEAIGGKWRPKVVVALAARGTLRYGELRDTLGVSDAVLSSTLKGLCDDGMAERIQYATMPPRVEYSLTEKGSASVEVLKAVVSWAGSFNWEAAGEESHLVKCDFHSPV